MKTYNLEIGGQVLEVIRDADGKFIIPDRFRETGTALKPAFEPIVLARKPLSEKTVAANVLRWGTGALNIDATRIPTDGPTARPPLSTNKHEGWQRPWNSDADARAGVEARREQAHDKRDDLGRWPANVATDGTIEMPGGAQRYFYSAKASKADRAGSKHPTVKPIALMQWLARLITPPGGTVLDPFAGSGTTGAACEREGFGCILVERESEYVADIRNRFGASVAPCPIARLLAWNAAVTAYRSAHV